MPELPDLELYLDAMRERIVDTTLERVRLASPFLLRSVTPPIDSAAGKRLLGIERLGKRLIFELEEGPFLIVHLMIAGRFQWRDRNATIPKRLGLAAFDFSSGTLLLTEASKQKRASLHLVADRAALVEFDRGGIDPLSCSVEEFAEALRRETHTIKRSLTDPRLLSGIGNAYSDEILHAAKLSPFTRTDRMDDATIQELHKATIDVLTTSLERLRQERKERFPAKVTAFHPAMAVHGKYGQPCPVCGDPVQRIVYASNEANYCATCQTGGKLLADRALSRLLKKDWPRSLEELEQRLNRERD